MHFLQSTCLVTIVQAVPRRRKIHPNPRTICGLRHILIVETGDTPLTSYHTEVPMNNCLCNVFDNNNWIWIVLIVLLFLCCNGCGC